MTNAIITPDQDSVVAEVEIAAPPERVFKAVCDREEVLRRAPYLDAYEMELRVSGRWYFEIDCSQNPHHGYARVRHEGEILELDPPRLLVYTWLANFHKDPKMRTIVRWETEANEGGNTRQTNAQRTCRGTRDRQGLRGGVAGRAGETENILGSVERSSSWRPQQSRQTRTLLRRRFSSPHRRCGYSRQSPIPSRRPNGGVSKACIASRSGRATCARGGKWSSVGVGADGTSFRVDGEYLEVNPPRLLVHTWIASWAGPLQMVVRWELEATDVHGLHPGGPKRAGTGTLVRIRHEGFAGAPQVATGHAEGWKRVLGWLHAYLERGETADTRKASA